MEKTVLSSEELSKLLNINPSWDDETIYQETRKIVVAELQHITYNEFIPILTGNKSLKPLNNDYYTAYDSSVK